jgi:hypothetical protein
MLRPQRTRSLWNGNNSCTTCAVASTFAVDARANEFVTAVSRANDFSLRSPQPLYRGDSVEEAKS